MTHQVSLHNKQQDTEEKEEQRLGKKGKKKKRPSLVAETGLGDGRQSKAKQRKAIYLIFSGAQ